LLFEEFLVFCEIFWRKKKTWNLIKFSKKKSVLSCFQQKFSILVKIITKTEKKSLMPPKRQNVQSFYRKMINTFIVPIK